MRRKQRKSLSDILSILFLQILRKSKIFNYWYKAHLNELLFDIEIADIDNEKIMKKYLKKLKAIS